MSWSEIIYLLIDFGSFSSLWYWIMVAVVWSSVSHWVLGVPYDLIARARRTGGQAEADLLDMVRINVNRLLGIAQSAGLILAALLSFVLTSLIVLGFYYRVELAQAVFLIAFPLTIVGAVSLATSRKLRAADPEAAELYPMLQKHRVITQIIGMIAIFITAMYGMYQNLDAVRSL